MSVSNEKWFNLGLFSVVALSGLWVYFRSTRYRLRERNEQKINASSTSVDHIVKAEPPSSTNGPDKLTQSEAEALTFLLTNASSDDLKQKVLVTVANKAAFTQNQITLREAGCLQQLTALLSSFQASHEDEYDSVSTSGLIQYTLIAINNLAMNEINQQELQDCIPSVMEFATSRTSGVEVQLAALKALVNLTCICDYQEQYFSNIQSIFDQTSAETLATVRLQCLKLLVNLSSNVKMTGYLLSAEIPNSFLMDIELNSSEDVLLRWLSFFKNLATNADAKRWIDEQEAEISKPLTVKDFLYGMSSQGSLRIKIDRLATHLNPDISNLALQLLSLDVSFADR